MANQEVTKLLPAPTVTSAKQDFYKVITVTLALIIVIGSVVTLASLVFYGPQRLFRTALTVTLITLAVHAGQAIFTSRTPHLEP